MRLKQEPPVPVTAGTPKNLFSDLSKEELLSSRSIFIRPVGGDVAVLGAQTDTAADSAVVIPDGASQEIEHCSGKVELWVDSLVGTVSVKRSINFDAAGR